jgi:hypothetical protein
MSKSFFTEDGETAEGGRGGDERRGNVSRSTARRLATCGPLVAP